MNDLDLRLEVRSTVALHLTLNISETVRDKGLVPKDYHRKWYMGYRMVTWPMTSRDLGRSNSWPQYAYGAISRKLLALDSSNLVCSFVLGMPSMRTNNFPESGRGLGHVTPTIFGIRSKISSKLLELETSNLKHGFVWAMPSRRTNNFHESAKWAWPRSRDRYNFWHYGRLS